MEFVADQFASRFGYGQETQEYLARIVLPNIKMFDQPTRTQSFMGFFIAFFFIFGSVALFYGGFLVVVVSGLAFILSSLVTMLGVTNVEIEQTYDIPYQRVEKNVLDAIRQIRLYGDKLSAKDKQRLLVTIDNLQKILEDIKSSGGSVNTVKEEKIFEWLNSKNRNIRELSDFSENIERLMENKLHADAIRF